MKAPGDYNPITWLMSGGNTLREQVLRGGAWLVIGDGIARGAGLLKVVVLARILSPVDFGLMGIALLALSSFEYFTETGFRAALIQKQGDVEPYLDTHWTLQIVRSALLAVVLLASAPWLAAALGAPQATPIVRGMALVTLVRAFSNPGALILRKTLQMRREVLWRSGGALAGLLVAVPVALIWRDVRALLFSALAAQAVETATSYLASPYRPRLSFDRQRARELARFGRWVFGNNILTFFATNLDSLAVSRLAGPAALGIYQIAQQLAFLVTAQFGTHVHGVMLPALSRVEGGAPLRQAWLRANRVLTGALLPLACFVSVFAEPLVLTIMGTRWDGSVPVVRVLVWAGVLWAVGRLNNALLQGAGHPELPLRATGLEILILVAVVYPLTSRFGVTGAAFALLGARALAFGLQLRFAMKLAGSSLSESLDGLKLGAAASVPFLVAAPLAQRDFSASAVAAVLLAAAASAVVLKIGIGSQGARPSGEPATLKERTAR